MSIFEKYTVLTLLYFDTLVLKMLIVLLPLNYIYYLFRYDGSSIPTWQGSSNHWHHFTDLGNYRNQAVTVGSKRFEYNAPNTKTEILKNQQWETVADTLPGVSEYIAYYSMATLEGQLYLFGKF